MRASQARDPGPNPGRGILGLIRVRGFLSLFRVVEPVEALIPVSKKDGGGSTVIAVLSLSSSRAGLRWIVLILMFT